MLLGDPDVDDAIGEALAERERPVESGIAAVMATTSGRASASSIRASVKAAVNEGGRRLRLGADLGVEDRRLMGHLVLLGGR